MGPRDLMHRLWERMTAGNFLTGLFFVLPLVLTAVILSWIVRQIESMIGPGSWFGDVITYGGIAIVGENHQVIAFWLGIAVTLCGLWALGFLIRTRLRAALEALIGRLFDRLPIIRAIYGPVAQVVDLLQRQDDSDVTTMSVVMCNFGADQGANILALQTSNTIYDINGKASLLIYFPTAPLPMSGGLMFVPRLSITPVPELAVDGVMRIYFSLGALGASVMPEHFHSNTGKQKSAPG